MLWALSSMCFGAPTVPQVGGVVHLHICMHRKTRFVNWRRDWGDCRCQTWVLTRWRDILAPAPWVPIAGGIGVVVVLDVPEALTAGGLAAEHTRIAPQESLMHGMVERGQGRKTAQSADPWYLRELQIRFVHLLRRIAWPECL